MYVSRKKGFDEEWEEQEQMVFKMKFTVDKPWIWSPPKDRDSLIALDRTYKEQDMCFINLILC